MRKNRVAFVTDEFITTHKTSGGLASYLYKRALQLISEGHEVHILVRADKSEVFLLGEIYVHHIGPKLGKEMILINFITNYVSKSVGIILYELKTSFNISRYFLKLNKKNATFNTVQIADYMFRGLFIPHGEYFRVVRSSWTRKAFMSADNEYGKMRDKVFYQLERLQLYNSECVLCPSQWLYRYYSKNESLSNLQYEKPRLPEIKIPIKRLGEPSFLHFGQISYRKGSDLVLEAFEIIANEGIEGINLLIVGSDRLGLARNNRIPNVTFIGPLERDELVQCIYDSIAVILPSRIDNSPNTALESIALSKKIITTKDSSIDDLLEEFNSEGIVLETYDAKELANTIKNEYLAFNNR